MKVTVDNGMMTFDVRELFDSLPIENKREFIDILSCDTGICDLVMQQVLDGWTELGSHGPKGHTATPSPRYGIDKARREIAKRSGEVAVKEIERLEKALAESEKRYQELSQSRRMCSY